MDSANGAGLAAKETSVDEFKPGGFLSDEPRDVRDLVAPHPWKSLVFVPMQPTPDQIEAADAIAAFQHEIDLLDTSWMDET